MIGGVAIISRDARMLATHTYDKVFFDYINEGSGRSARRIVPLLMQMASPLSVLDIGSGAGAWLKEWSAYELDDWIGVDGDYVDLRQLLIPPAHFLRRDLSQPFSLGRKFDLVCSFEVAEHISLAYADQFVDNAVAHGDVVASRPLHPARAANFTSTSSPTTIGGPSFSHAATRVSTPCAL